MPENSKWDSQKFPIGEALLLARRYRNMSQGELADKSGVHMNSISALERGARPPRFSVLVKLSIALDVELSRIVKKAERMRTSL